MIIPLGINNNSIGITYNNNKLIQERIKKIAIVALTFMGAAAATVFLWPVSIGLACGIAATITIIGLTILCLYHKKTKNQPFSAGTQLPNTRDVVLQKQPVRAGAHFVPSTREEFLQNQISSNTRTNSIPTTATNLFANDTPLGVQSSASLRTFQLALDDISGTPGVNRAGTDIEDREMVKKRIQKVKEQITPYAHTERSYERFHTGDRSWTQRITFEALDEGTGNGQTLIPILDRHAVNKHQMMKKFQKQLTVSIIGAGPIGLAAALMFYELGFKVECHEKYDENNFATRRQPFSLVRQSYWFLSALGIQKSEIIDAFGNTEELFERIPRHGGYDASAFVITAEPKMRSAKAMRIGMHAERYIPNNISLPIYKMQKLLQGTIKDIQRSDDQDLNLIFDEKLIQSELNENNRKTLILENKNGQRKIAPDVIFNASGGKVNELLGFKADKIANFYGMGAFYNPPERATDLSVRNKLSRAVRPFCSFNKNEPIYCGIELTEEEYHNREMQKKVVARVAEDLNLPPKTEDFFTVPVNLEHTQTTMFKSDEEIPQLTMTGGDATLKPHFLTASGANFGLLGLIGLNSLLEGWLKVDKNLNEVLDEYNELTSLLQRQSCQMVLNLFGRELV